MSYCLNPACQKPYNPDNAKFCLSCRSLLSLKNHYRALEPLGEGGMGRTFLAVDEDRLNARCVIKQLLPAPEIQSNSQAMAKATELFEQEARQLLQLGDRHPQIPSLLAYFEQEKRLYLIQQLIEGADLLTQLQRRGPFDEAQIRALLFELLPAIQFIHDSGVIHRDLKPSNIIQTSPEPGGQTRLVLIDFGISKSLSETGLAKTGTRTGTEGYAPIEQLRGGRAYPASDLYSLGVTCLQLLCGAPPSQLYDPIALRWVWREVLRRQGRDVGDAIAYILDKMVAEAIASRYPSANDVLQDLDRALPNPDRRSSPVPFWEQPAKPPPARVSAPVASPGVVPSLPPWDCIATLTHHGGAVRAIAVTPDGSTGISGGDDRAIVIWNMDSGEIRHRLSGHSSAILTLAIAKNSKIFASGSADKTIKVWQTETGFLLRTLTGHSAPVSAIAIAPDGQTLVSGSLDRTIKLWDLRSGRLKRTFPQRSSGVVSLSLGRSGKLLISGNEDGAIDIWQVHNGYLKKTLAGHADAVSAIAIAPDETTAVTCSRDKTIRTWQLKTGQLLAHPKPHSKPFHAIAYLPVAASANQTGDRIIASAGEDKTVKIWHLETGNLLQTLNGHTDTIYYLLSVDISEKLLTGSADKTIKIWHKT
ncbi:serine/threonine-protein kinase [Oxynema aestuarii]|uniref:Protein kinase n=1 Tax=Oxynema aestuarii AP17 TaxID=2064643 RepID=A0A6H1TX35_9CYAN|nr:serine/threonine-protein kinase [Oxynema aestuarii]QIZ71162.1 protein kinase [Oxynema aestuarii AP17]RMH76955.1 MAG: hypothetical protein D6680_07020 [Cyanobacteria bacterium J007]